MKLSKIFSTIKNWSSDCYIVKIHEFYEINLIEHEGEEYNINKIQINFNDECFICDYAIMNDKKLVAFAYMYSDVKLINLNNINMIAIISDKR